jgi:hypothetical protein
MRLGVSLLFLVLGLAIASPPAVAQAPPASDPGKAKEAKKDKESKKGKGNDRDGPGGGGGSGDGEGSPDDGDDSPGGDEGSPDDGEGSPDDDGEAGPGGDDGETGGEPGGSGFGGGGGSGGVDPGDSGRSAVGSGSIDPGGRSSLVGSAGCPGGCEVLGEVVQAGEEDGIVAAVDGSGMQDVSMTSAEAVDGTEPTSFQEEAGVFSSSSAPGANPGVLALLALSAVGVLVGLIAGARALHGRSNDGYP